MKTVILSDCHIGSPEANLSNINRFLSMIDCDRMILAGDIWDLWEKSAEKIRKDHAPTIKLFERILAKGVKIEYVLGNHDEKYLKDPVIPLDQIPIVPKLNLSVAGKKVAIIHGHEFDSYYTNYYYLGRLISFVNFLGAKLLNISDIDFKKKTVNSLRGEEYSKSVRKIHDAARMHYFKLGYDVLIMGHTHAPLTAPKKEGYADLYNSGDWKTHDSYVCIKDDAITVRHLAGDYPASQVRWFRLGE